MYFIVFGTCVVEPSGTRAPGSAQFGPGSNLAPLTTVTAGSYFGEMALIADVRRSDTVVAATVCDISVLTRESLVEVLKLFPKARE